MSNLKSDVIMIAIVAFLFGTGCGGAIFEMAKDVSRNPMKGTAQVVEQEGDEPAPQVATRQGSPTAKMRMRRRAVYTEPDISGGCGESVTFYYDATVGESGAPIFPMAIVVPMTPPHRAQDLSPCSDIDPSRRVAVVVEGEQRIGYLVRAYQALTLAHVTSMSNFEVKVLFVSSPRARIDTGRIGGDAKCEIRFSFGQNDFLRGDAIRQTFTGTDGRRRCPIIR